MMVSINFYCKNIDILKFEQQKYSNKNHMTVTVSVFFSEKK